MNQLKKISRKQAEQLRSAVRKDLLDYYVKCPKTNEGIKMKTVQEEVSSRIGQQFPGVQFDLAMVIGNQVTQQRSLWTGK